MRTSLVVAAFTLFTGCTGTLGSRVEAQVSRDVGAFKRVSIGSGLEAHVTQGARGLTLKGDDNLLEFVETLVEGDTLVARLQLGTFVLPSKPLQVLVSNDLLEGVTASGAAHVTATATPIDEFAVHASGASEVEVTGLSSTRLVVGASGASQVTLSGAAKAAALTASGGSRVDTRGVPLESATLDVSGGSTLHAAVSSSVAGAASGGSSVLIIGTPAGEVSVTGGSRLAKGAQ